MVQRRVVTAALAAAVLLVTTGCSSDDGEKTDAAGSPPPSSSSAGSSPPGKAADEPPPAKGSVKVVRTVAEGLDTPWGLASLPEGGLLVSSRDGATISRIDEKTGKQTELGEVPGVAPAGEGGLMGIALFLKQRGILGIFPGSERLAAHIGKVDRCRMRAADEPHQVGR